MGQKNKSYVFHVLRVNITTTINLYCTDVQPTNLDGLIKEWR